MSKINYRANYNTKLTKKENIEFLKWVAEESARTGTPVIEQMNNFDLQGYWKSGDYKAKTGTGFPDVTKRSKWMKPNSSVFNSRSKYYSSNLHGKKSKKLPTKFENSNVNSVEDPLSAPELDYTDLGEPDIKNITAKKTPPVKDRITKNTDSRNNTVKETVAKNNVFNSRQIQQPYSRKIEQPYKGTPTPNEQKLTVPPKALGLDNLNYLSPQDNDGVGRLEFAQNGMQTPQRNYDRISPKKLPRSLNPQVKYEDEAGLVDTSMSETDAAILEAQAKELEGLENVEEFGLTTGDMIGIGGTIAGGVTQIANSLAAARATKDNINRWLGYNEKSLKVNRQLQDDIARNKETVKRETERRIKLGSTTSKRRNRGSASGISQLRAMDLATDYANMETEIGAMNNIEDVFGKQTIAAKGKEQDLLTQQDQMEMSGWERKDEKDQQDLDNAYTNYAQNLATITQNTQKLGSDLNRAQERRHYLKILKDTNAQGVGYVFNGEDFDMVADGKKNYKYSPYAKTRVVGRPIASPSMSMEEEFLYDLPEMDFVEGYMSNHYEQ